MRNARFSEDKLALDLRLNKAWSSIKPVWQGGVEHKGIVSLTIESQCFNLHMSYVRL